MKSFNQFLIFILLQVAVFSCSNDDSNGPLTCIEDPNLGDFFLLESSKGFVPYGEQELGLIFSDSLGNEYRGNYLPGEFETCEAVSSYSLDRVGSMECPINYLVECQTSRIIFEDFGGLEIQMMTSMSVDYSVDKEEAIFSDYLYILFFESDPVYPGNLHPLPNSGLFINIDRRTDDRAFILLTQANLDFMFDLHDKTFENVYSKDYLGPDVVQIFDLYFSRDVGIVGFENFDKSISLKFERIE